MQSNEEGNEENKEGSDPNKTDNKILNVNT
jgi:hypothetical protein